MREPGIDVHFDAGPYTPDRFGIPPRLRAGTELEEVIVPIMARGQMTEPEREAMRDFKNRSMVAARAATHTWVVYGATLSAQLDAQGRVNAQQKVLGVSIGVPSDMVAMSAQATESVPLESLTLMHELGHTLGLRHGGSDDIGYKPNYLSVMNYAWSLDNAGLRRDGRSQVLDFSRYSLVDLDESSLDEQVGLVPAGGTAPPSGVTMAYVCDRKLEYTEATGPVDWNCNGSIDAERVAASVHSVDGSDKTLLVSRNDWASLVFTGGVRGGLLSTSEVLDETGFDTARYRAGPKEHAVLLRGASALEAPAGDGPRSIRFTIENIGEADDTYKVDVDVTGGSADAPDQIEVSAGELENLTVFATPDRSTVGDGYEVKVTVTSVADHKMLASARTKVEIVDDAGTLPEVGRLRIEPNTAKPGETVSVSGDGFQPGTPLVLAADETAPRTVEADGAGAVRVEIAVPRNRREELMVTVVGPRAGSAVGTAGSTSTTRPRTTSTRSSTSAPRGSNPPGTAETGDTIDTPVLQLVGTVALDTGAENAAPATLHANSPEVAAERTRPQVLLVVGGVAVAAAIAGVVLVRRARRRA